MGSASSRSGRSAGTRSCPLHARCAASSCRLRRRRTALWSDQSRWPPSSVQARRRRRWPWRRRRRSGIFPSRSVPHHRDRDSLGEEPLLNRRPPVRVVPFPPRDRVRFDRDRTALPPQSAHDELLQIGRARLEVTEQCLGRVIHHMQTSLPVVSRHDVTRSRQARLDRVQRRGIPSLHVVPDAAQGGFDGQPHRRHRRESPRRAEGRRRRRGRSDVGALGFPARREPDAEARRRLSNLCLHRSQRPRPAPDDLRRYQAAGNPLRHPAVPRRAGVYLYGPSEKVISAWSRTSRTSCRISATTMAAGSWPPGWTNKLGDDVPRTPISCGLSTVR